MLATPQDAPVLSGARDALLRGETDQALESARMAAQADPADPAVLNVLGLCQLAAGRVDAAADSFSGALAAEPEDPRYGLNLARAHLVLGTPERGLEILERNRTDPDDVTEEVWLTRRALIVSLHEARAAAGQPDPSRLTGWLGENPDDADARLLLAGSYLESGAYAEAAAQYEVLMAAGTADAGVYNNLAWSYLRLGDTRARRLAEQARELAPDDGAVLDTLGWILVSADAAEQGLPLLRDAHLLEPGDPEVAYHLAVALSRTGQESEAKAMLERLIRTGAGTVEDSAMALLNTLEQGG
jgi:Flp pilus assembly protein TadD